MRVPALVFAVVLTASCSSERPDYISMVQNAESAYPGVRVKQYVEELARVSLSAGNKTMSGGWTWEGARGGYIVKYNLKENDQDRSFAWFVNEAGRIEPQNDLARGATGPAAK